MLGVASLLFLQQPDFSYDQKAPLQIAIRSKKKLAEAVVSDVTFRGHRQGRTEEAFIVEPRVKGKFPAILFVHWFEPGNPTSNRTEFLDEAKELAKNGVVSILPTAFWSDAKYYDARRWQDDYQRSIDQTISLRRALDVLTSMSNVDPKRIMVVGHDYGGMFGVMTASADSRPMALVVIAATPSFPDWYLFGSSTGVPKGDDLVDFKRKFESLEPKRALSQKNIPVLFQFGESDPYVPRPRMIDFYMAAKGPKQIKTYDSNHPMEAKIIRYDRDEWIFEHLGLAKAIRQKK